jgi:hypothetical protein
LKTVCDILQRDAVTCSRFEFARGASTLKYYEKTPHATFSGEFSRVDVDKFNELLKQLPQAQAELEGKIAKAQKEAVLFEARSTPIQDAPKPTEASNPEYATLLKAQLIQLPERQQGVSPRRVPIRSCVA